MGLFLIDGQPLACDGFAVLGVKVRSHRLDGLAVQSCAGKVGQADLVATNFQVAGRAFCKGFLDLGSKCFLLGLCCLNQLGGFFVLLLCVTSLFVLFGGMCVPDGMSISLLVRVCKME